MGERRLRRRRGGEGTSGRGAARHAAAEAGQLDAPRHGVPPRADGAAALRPRGGRPRRRRGRAWGPGGRRDVVPPGADSPAAERVLVAARRRADGARGETPPRATATRWCAPSSPCSSRPAATPTSSWRCFDADHGDRAEAVGWAGSRSAKRPSVYAHDALGWGACTGRATARRADEARRANRLGTADPLVRSTSARSPACAGQRSEAIAALHRARAQPRLPPVVRAGDGELLQRLEGPADVRRLLLAPRSSRSLPATAARTRGLHREPVRADQVAPTGVDIRFVPRPGGDPTLQMVQAHDATALAGWRARVTAVRDQLVRDITGRIALTSAAGGPARRHRCDAGAAQGQGGLATTRLDSRCTPTASGSPGRRSSSAYRSGYAADRSAGRRSSWRAPTGPRHATTAATVDATDGLRSYRRTCPELPAVSSPPPVDARLGSAASRSARSTRRQRRGRERRPRSPGRAGAAGQTRTGS
jgi:hypothetical protein